MKKIIPIALLILILALGSCASSKPCPAYAKSAVAEKSSS